MNDLHACFMSLRTSHYRMSPVTALKSWKQFLQGQLQTVPNNSHPSFQVFRQNEEIKSENASLDLCVGTVTYIWGSTNFKKNRWRWIHFSRESKWVRTNSRTTELFESRFDDVELQIRRDKDQRVRSLSFWILETQRSSSAGRVQLDSFVEDGRYR